MRIRIKADGREYEGTPEEIVSQMRSVASRDDESLEDYMGWATDTVRQLAGVSLPDEARRSAEAFVRGMVDHGLAEQVSG
jgi:hypothetical protein